MIARPQRLSARNDNTARQRLHRMAAHQKPQRRAPSAIGLEMLDHLGIDIDQDPSAFAKFLELRNQTL